MAGGIGTRLKPFTSVLPKPLIPIKDKTAIEHIIDGFISHGFKSIYISINNNNKILRAFFDESKLQIKINFIKEINQLGTAGSLRFFLKKKYENILVVNCDTITLLDLTNLIEFHKKKKSNFTIVVSKKNIAFPTG